MRGSSNDGCEEGILFWSLFQGWSNFPAIIKLRTSVKPKKADVFNGIMAAHIFPSLADVLTESLDSDEFGPLDLSLANMAGTSTFPKGLDEHDFMNQHVLYEKEIKEEPKMQELSQPDDLLIHLPMWPDTVQLGNFDENVNNEVGLVECEVEIGQGSGTPSSGYPRSPGSTGDNSDYNSDSSFEHHNNYTDSKRMITLERVQLPPRMDIKQEFMPYNSDNKDNLNIHMESPSNIPHPSIIPPFYHDQTPDDDDEDQSMTDSGSESGSDSKESSEETRKRPGRKKGQTSSVYHLWEFIRDLLHDPQYCPRIIKWESKEEGIFRVVKSSEVAKQWGSKKKNRSKMTYEKLSRSLRYSRKEGYFADIPKDKGYPKKLCFKFGPKSHGWAHPGK
ncbi:hypothetical protein FSP39_011071 [Pinctada imbricata]|uniref:ETS domain-containing protein n=1 Tax=Pinctada imbricata TaxID=66713 RepID=A0AA89C1E2_PINIB|nr:hypothetical protein FSP39_011071 [Pinctada imbricata]